MHAQKSNGISGRTIAIFATILIVVVAATVFVVMQIMTPIQIESREIKPDIESGQQQGVTVMDTAPETPARKSSGIKIPGWGCLNFTAGTTESTVSFYNPEENEGKYYLTFEVKIPINGEYKTVYKSGMINPGYSVQNVTLDEPLEAGEYEGIVHVQPYTMEDNPVAVNNADMRTKIVVS